MTEISDRIAELEQDISDKKEESQLYDALSRLTKNADFDLLIKDGYFREEAIRLVSLKSAPDFQTPDQQTHIIRQIDSIGELKSYFQRIAMMGENAQRDIASMEEEIVHLSNGGEMIHG